MSTLATMVVSLVGDISGFKSAMDDAQKTARSAGDNIASGLGSALGGIGKVAAVGAAAAAAGVAAIGTAALAAAQDLDSAYDTIAIKTGATGAALDGLKNDFAAVFSTFPANAESVGGVVGELNTRLGITGKTLENLAGPILEASRMMGGDATENAKLFSRVIGDWGLPLEDASVYLDELFVVAQKTGVPLGKLQEQIVQFGSPMRLMGFSLEESAALMGKWEKEGVNTELVLGSLRIAAGKFAKEQSSTSTVVGGGVANMAEAQKKMLELQVHLQKAQAGQGKLKTDAEKQLASIKIAEYENQIGSLQAQMAKGEFVYAKAADSQKTLRDRLVETFDSIKNNKDASAALAQGMEVFGARAGPDMVAAIREGRFAVDDLVGALDSADGAILKAGAATADFPEKFQVLKNKVELILAPLGMLIMDTIGKALDAIAPLLDKVGAMFGDFMEGATAGGGFDVFAGLSNIFKKLAKTDATGTFKSIGEAITNIGNTVQPVIDGILNGFQTIFLWLQTNAPAIQSAIATAWQNIRAVVEPAVNAIGAFIQSVFGAVGTFLQTHGAEITTWIGNTWSTIRSIVEPVIQWFYDTITTVFGGIAIWISENQSGIQAVFQGVWDGIKMFVGTVLEAIRGIVNVVLALLRGDVQGALDAIGQTFVNIWNGIKDYVGRAVETVRMILLIAWAGIQQGVSDAWTGIRTWIENAWQSIIDFFNTLPGRLVEIGRNIIQGLIDGIKTGFDNLGNSIREGVEGAIAQTKKNLGIQSPSTVFAEIGLNMMRGMSQGILENASLPQNALSSLALNPPAIPAAEMGTAFGRLAAPAEGLANAIGRTQPAPIEEVMQSIGRTQPALTGAGAQPSTNNTTTINEITINIAAVGRDYTPQQAGDEIVDRLRARGIIA